MHIVRVPLLSCYLLQWPGIGGAVHPVNAGLRLFGGAAFERCLAEFLEAARGIEFPQCE